MSGTDKTPPPRRTIAVTVAGVLLLMLPAAFAFMAAIFLVDRLGSRRVPIDFTFVGINFAFAGCLAMPDWQ
jgi:hypothetical protein